MKALIFFALLLAVAAVTHSHCKISIDDRSVEDSFGEKRSVTKRHGGGSLKAQVNTLANLLHVLSSAVKLSTALSERARAETRALKGQLASLSRLLNVQIGKNAKGILDLKRRKGWPAGHYCIMRSGSCPPGFTGHSGHMRAIYQYAASATYITPVTFGNSRIVCHGRCGQYGNWVGDLYLSACCK